ncbi:MAG: DPP IV N-terminal domain-containing protein [Balneolaceae bacterium]
MKRSLLLIILFLFSVPAIAQQDDFNYMDIFDLQMVSGPEISPDGNTIIYQRLQFDVNTDRSYTNLWRISFGGDDHRPLTTGKNSYGNVTWSPGGNRIAYTSNEEGSSQIFIRWMETGETTAITNLENSPGNLQWSPDGSMLLFTQQISAKKPSIGSFPGPPEGAEWSEPASVIDHVTYRRDGTGFTELTHSQIFIISAEGGAPRQLTSGEFSHHSPSWAPDGEYIIFTADRTGNEDLDPNNAQIYELDIETEELTQISDKRGPHNNPVISPDGDYIAFTGYEDQFLGYQLTDLYVMNRDGSGLHKISDSVEQDISSITWAADSNSLFFRFDEEGNSKIGNISLDGEAVTIAENLGSASIGRPYGGGSYSIAENGRFTYPLVTTSRPAELAAGHYPTRMANRQLTNLNEQLFKAKRTGNVEEIWIDSSVDDYRVHGWMITPPDFDPNRQYPLILEIHGGPHTNYGSRFSPELQLMASQGYVVLYTNPRGSTSYGADFAGYINHNYPSEDHNDLMDAVDAVSII